MRVGGSLYGLYKLPGLLPAGEYKIGVFGFTRATDARLRAELLYRSASNADTVLGTVDSVPIPRDTGTSLKAWIEGSLDLPTLQAQQGESLLLHIVYVSGSADFYVLETSLTIP